MRKMLLSFSLIASLAAACGKSGGTPSKSEYDAVMAKMTGMKDKVCACPDLACATAAAEPAAALEQEVKQKFPKPTAEQREAFGGVIRDLQACLHK